MNNCQRSKFFHLEDWEKINILKDLGINTLLQNLKSELLLSIHKLKENLIILSDKVSNMFTKEEVANKLNTKQDTLQSGQNIKTINNQSILGSGNISIEGIEDVSYNEVQYLTDNQKKIARNNINAVASESTDPITISKTGGAKMQILDNTAIIYGEESSIILENGSIGLEQQNLVVLGKGDLNIVNIDHDVGNIISLSSTGTKIQTVKSYIGSGIDYKSSEIQLKDTFIDLSCGIDGNPSTHLQVNRENATINNVPILTGDVSQLHTESKTIVDAINEICDEIIINVDGSETTFDELRNARTYRKIVVNYSMIADTFKSICLPFNLNNNELIENFGENYILEKYNGFEIITDEKGPKARLNSTIQVYELEAGKPYVIKPSKTINKIIVHDKVVTTTLTPTVLTNEGYKCTLIGDFIAKQISSQLPMRCFALSDGEWKEPMGSVELKGYRIYYKSEPNV